jgi:hypothetical protein
MSNRDARPLSEKAMSLFHDAAIEEIHQGLERYGIPVLFDLHSGLRKRLVTHFSDGWRELQDGNEVIQTPKLIECDLTPDGCRYCNADRSGGPDGYVRAKTGQGAQRTVPIFTTWFDYHRGEERPTEVSKWLDHWFKSNDGPGWGYERATFKDAVKTVAQRRGDLIAEEHEGKEEVYIQATKQEAPDIIPHDLRATWATQCLRVGVEDSTIMDWAGWKDRTMLDHYRGFIEDPEGTERDKYETGREDDDDQEEASPDMEEVYEVYQKITLGEQVNPSRYSNAVLEAAYEMVEAS